MLITGLEATENHVKVLAFYKAVEPQFIEQCEYGRRLPRGGDQDPQAIGTARLLRACRERGARFVLNKHGYPPLVPYRHILRGCYRMSLGISQAEYDAQCTSFCVPRPY